MPRRAESHCGGGVSPRARAGAATPWCPRVSYWFGHGGLLFVLRSRPSPVQTRHAQTVPRATRACSTVRCHRQSTQGGGCAVPTGSRGSPLLALHAPSPNRAKQPEPRWQHGRLKPCALSHRPRRQESDYSQRRSVAGWCACCVPTLRVACSLPRVCLAMASEARVADANWTGFDPVTALSLYIPILDSHASARQQPAHPPPDPPAA